MPERSDAAAVLNSYISELISDYSHLLKILRLERDDIESSDERSLEQHSMMEEEAIKKISGLWKVILTYMENTGTDAAAAAGLKEAEKLRKDCAACQQQNISLLGGELERLKGKLASFKLPKTARRVYYSGETSSIMDIEI